MCGSQWYGDYPYLMSTKQCWLFPYDFGCAWQAILVTYSGNETKLAVWHDIRLLQAA